jgi:vacuolar-type H+-ATPase subunit H
VREAHTDDRGDPDSAGFGLCHVFHEVVEKAATSSVVGHAPVRAGGSILERFRGTAGVPAAVGEETIVELVPVFAALDAFEIEAAEVRERAEAMTAHRLHEAEEGAREILAAARSLADSERGDALKAGLRAADVEASQIVARAEAEARLIDERGRARLPALVDKVVARVLEAS